MEKRANQEGFRAFLKQEFELRCQSESKYSLRRFAKDLGEDPSALARLLHGKVAAGPRTIDKLGKALLLSVDEVSDFKAEAQRRRRASRSAPEKKSDFAPSPIEYQGMQADTFRVISDWYHFAILELIQLKNFKPQAAWIAKQLDIPSSEAHFALDRLERLGLIERSASGIKDLTGGWTTNISQPFFDPGHRRLQKQLLEKAIRALETKPVAKRDQSGITLAFPTSRMSEAKQRIKEFRRNFNKEFGAGEDRDSVYQLSISFYPLVDSIEEKEQ